MRPQMQAFKHDPANGVFGDCLRTAIAAVLDLDRDDVPHFMDGQPDNSPSTDGHMKLDAWLRKHGLIRICVIYGEMPLQQLLNTVYFSNPHLGDKLCYLLTGQSRLGVNHVVACQGNQIVCDPSGNSIVGPCDDGHYWVEFFGSSVALA